MYLATWKPHFLRCSRKGKPYAEAPQGKTVAGHSRCFGLTPTYWLTRPKFDGQRAAEPSPRPDGLQFHSEAPGPWRVAGRAASSSLEPRNECQLCTDRVGPRLCSIKGTGLEPASSVRFCKDEVAGHPVSVVMKTGALAGNLAPANRAEGRVQASGETGLAGAGPGSQGR